MGKITVRVARPEEASALTDICKRSKAYWGYDAEFMRLSALSLTVTPEAIATRRVLVAENEHGAVLGVVAAMPMPEDGVYDLDRLFIDPSAIKTGVGRVLFLAAADLARKEGAKELSILADRNAGAFYERMGATYVGEAVSDSIPGRVLPVYQFDL
jgi:N-acetylglutamate synthase-like GNAT family acetyltransferase